MTVGEIIFAVMVAIQGVLFLIGLAFLIADIVKKGIKKSYNLCIIALILWGIGPLFSMVGVFFGFFYS